MTETPTPTLSPSKIGPKPGRKTYAEIAHQFAHELTQQGIDSTEWHVLVGQVKAAVAIAKALKR